MGCLPSKLPFSSSNSKPTTAHMQKLHPLTRPAKYQGGKGPSFYAAYARAARRYGFETGRNAGFAKRNNVVVKVKSKHDKDTDHEVPAESIQNGLEYVVPVKIGTPGVTLNLDFDTGSSDLWVWSSELAHASRYKGHNVYDPKKSSTAKKASGSWNISYGDGSSASGNVYNETVTVGDIAIPGQAVELAEELSPSFLQDGGNDGLLGLAWPAINTVSPKPVATPVENMINKKLIDPPVFTVKLGRGDEAGFYSFGFIDTSVTTDEITYTSVDNYQGFWQVPSTSWTLNGSTKNRSGNTTILDTGTTLLLVSDDVVDELYGAIEGAQFDNEQGGYKFPSSATLPDVSFAVGDKLYKVSGQDLAFADAGDGFVFGGIQSRGNLDFDIFGDIFLKNVYVVFNQGETTVGLAQRTD
ncbi:acid protease [Lentinus tigrinus ALCF2SS1-7]|uniref:Acid protease n=1 Tax=Lentinus tigrinus ALCF2SS1-6 TaxID=1328759 RepID=A0A5C2SV30_9APHY|nr:acid protease [Lentinus tigrinus ALCF2SS1-6]RPD81409.1 acid protease [Lentinus tigrinus ALCF2SS1-7]